MGLPTKSHVQFTRFIAILGEFKNRYPSRVSAQEMQDALIFANTHRGLDTHGTSTRNIQRILVEMKNTGVIAGDGEFPQGWRLTAAGCEFLGLGGTVS